MEKIKAFLVYVCPATNKKVESEIGSEDDNVYYYGSDNYYKSRIYKCKSCGKEHEIELN